MAGNIRRHAMSDGGATATDLLHPHERASRVVSRDQPVVLTRRADGHAADHTIALQPGKNSSVTAKIGDAGEIEVVKFGQQITLPEERAAAAELHHAQLLGVVRQMLTPTNDDREKTAETPTMFLTLRRAAFQKLLDRNPTIRAAIREQTERRRGAAKAHGK